MRKLAIGIGILFLIALAMPALAANGNAAVVEKDTGCGIYVGPYGGAILASDSQGVINGNNWKFTCFGQLADGVTPPEKAFKINEVTDPDVICIYNGMVADSFNTVITPSGQVILSCQGTVVV